MKERELRFGSRGERSILMVDAGGVLFNNVTEDSDFVTRLSTRFDLSDEHVQGAFDTFDHLWETDSMDVLDVLSRHVLALGRPFTAEESRWCSDTYADSVQDNKLTFESLRQLRSDYPDLTMILVNNEAKRWDLLKNQLHRHFELFDKVASSWIVGSVKPSAAYFSYVSEEAGVDLCSAAIVDDNLDVLRVAAQHCVQTFHFGTTWPDRTIRRWLGELT